jgi:hypothetical protein
MSRIPSTKTFRRSEGASQLLGKSAGYRGFDLLCSSQCFKLPLKQLFMTNFKGSIIPRGTLHMQAQGFPNETQVLRTGSVSIETVRCESAESVI